MVFDGIDSGKTGEFGQSSMPKHLIVVLGIGIAFAAWPPVFAQTPSISPPGDHLLELENRKADTAPTIVYPKLEASLRERAKREQTLAVFLVLKNQPQREILERLERAVEGRKQLAEAHHRRIVADGNASQEELRSAGEELEAITLETRQNARGEIGMLINGEQSALESKLVALGGSHIQRYAAINMMRVDIPSSVLGTLEADPDIAEIQPVGAGKIQLNMSVPALGADTFWIFGYTGIGQSVAVIDTGVATSHPAFSGKAIVNQVFLTNGSLQPCFADNPNSATDIQGHRTHVAGIVMSQGSLFWSSYQGVAKGITTLYNLKASYLDCTRNGHSMDPDVMAALDWLVANTGTQIVNYSSCNM